MQLCCVTVALISNISIPISWEYDSTGSHLGYCQLGNKCIIIIGMPFRKNLVDKFNPNSFFPTPKICHIKFDSVFDPSKDIMLGIEGIKYCRIIPGS